MNQNLIINMRTVVSKMEDVSDKNKKEYNPNALKTLSNTYQSLLSQILDASSIEKIGFEDVAELKRQRKELLNLNDKLLNTLLMANLNDNEFKQSDSIATASGKINRLIVTVGEVVSSQLSVKYEIKQRIDNSLAEKTRVLMKDYHRGEGKTLYLATLAEKLGATLLVPYEVNKRRVLNDMCFDIEVGAFNNVNTTRGRRLLNKSFLADEGVSDEIVEHFVDCGYTFLGGIK